MFEFLENCFINKTSIASSEKHQVLECKVGSQTARYLWEEGMFSRSSEEELTVHLEVALSEAQVSDFAKDQFFFSKAYIKGDIKPKGSMQLFLAWLSVLESGK